MRTSLCNSWFSLCCLSASVPLPANSALCSEMMLSIMISLALNCSMNLPMSFINSSRCELLYALAMWTFFSTSSESSPLARAIWSILSGLNVPSVSIKMVPLPSPPSCTGLDAMAQSVWHICDLPLPNSR